MLQACDKQDGTEQNNFYKGLRGDADPAFIVEVRPPILVEMFSPVTETQRFYVNIPWY